MAAQPSVSTDTKLVNALKNTRVIAMIGASEKSDRDSNHVMKYLLEQGYTV